MLVKEKTDVGVAVASLERGAVDPVAVVMVNIRGLIAVSYTHLTLPTIYSV